MFSTLQAKSWGRCRSLGELSSPWWYRQTANWSRGTPETQSILHLGISLREVAVSDGKLGVKRFSLSGQGGALAISQGASTVAAVVYDGRLRLMTFETASGRETDISHLLENIDPRTIQHLCTSLQGDRLLVGAESDLCVLDLAGKRSSRSAGEAATPSITPDGQRVAFVEDGVVVIYEFKSNQFEKMPSAWQVDWLGAWSPNGKFLLAAGRKPFSFRYRVFAIDIEQQDFAEVMDEPDEVLPGLSWVNRRFATKLGPPRPL